MNTEVKEKKKVEHLKLNKDKERVRKEIKAWRPYNTLTMSNILTDTRTPICK